MPIIVNFVFENDSIATHRLPAEIWRFDDTLVTKVLSQKNPLKKLSWTHTLKQLI